MKIAVQKIYLGSQILSQSFQKKITKMIIKSTFLSQIFLKSFNNLTSRKFLTFFSASSKEILNKMADFCKFKFISIQVSTY